ncbi:MAG TPA: DNA topoisomerase I [Candidatus Nanoarchaeia archaeon]|nr:DNA topoisomerase I [Candidatus Nanoarchaeia archaeon]
MKGKYELVICEKPNAALKVATALADKKTTKKAINKVAYYELEHNGKKIVVGCAVGHLFNLAEKDKKAWTYPIFSFEWKPSYEINKESKYTKSYIDVLSKLAKNADEFTIGCDYDNEGSVIGFNIIRFICNRKDAKRMKFSTLTNDELVESYEHAMPHLDFPQIESGVTRHSLDWLWGLNLSRALTLSIKNSIGMFKILSTGRVQGPTLKVLYIREKEIEIFKPTPYWEIELLGKTNKNEELIAWHKKGKFWDKARADDVMKKCKGKKAIVLDIEVKEFKQKSPFPFDLTSLQIEAYSTLGLSPQKTLDIAQDLYTNGWISYPRTSSQKLPAAIGYKKIISKLSKVFEKECKILLNKYELKPNEGKKEDAAHPAIFPTGDLPDKLEEKSHGLYELIVRRFFATFGEDAIRETMNIKLDVNKEIFVANGTRTKFKGWHELYGRFVKLEEEELPKLNKNDEVKVEKLNQHSKETKPPARYTEASLIKELESKSLGTKATRSIIIQNLFDRNYIRDKSIEVTTLGKTTVETLEKYCPEVLDEELTRKFEEDMDEIEKTQKKGDEIIEDAKKFLSKALEKFKKHEKEIGSELGKAAIETRNKENFIGKCPKCKEGDLQVRRGKFGMFAACSKYPDCKTTFALPKFALIKGAEKDCPVCNYPMVLIIKSKKRPQELCINPNCESKKQEEEKFKALAKNMKCPNCSSELIVKKSPYGFFIACPGYPKCKYIAKIEETKE